MKTPSRDGLCIMLENKTFKKIILSIFIAIILICGALAYSVNAGVGLPFGGKVFSSSYCTISQNFIVKMVSPIPPYAVFLIFQPGVSLLFRNFIPMVPLVWDLGTFIPGVGLCIMGVGDGSVILPTLGTMTMVGTSLPSPR